MVNYMFEQIKLPYGFDDLEPYFDTLTMETHYLKHHAAYTKNINDNENSFYIYFFILYSNKNMINYRKNI